jgi:hypothetical protein
VRNEENQSVDDAAVVMLVTSLHSLRVHGELKRESKKQPVGYEGLGWCLLEKPSHSPILSSCHHSSRIRSHRSIVRNGKNSTEIMC